MPLILGVTGIAALVVAAAPGVAAAAPNGSGGNYTCSGTSASPGTLAGNFANVTIAGTCLIDAGNVNIAGNLTVADGASLVGDFGMNDRTDSGTSNLTVGGNVVVEFGASLMIGCYPLQVTLWGGPPPSLFTTPDFPCDDDPNAFPASGISAPTLSATERIGGSLISYDPLGVVVHNATVGGSVEQAGGGDGATNSNPVGIFAQYIAGGPVQSNGLDTPIPLPAYSDYGNINIGGNMVITGMNINWFGIYRNTVRGNLIDTDNQSTTDANETNTNTVYGNLVCSGNSPAVEYGDSNGTPNKVGGNATGECGFNVLIPNPAPASVPGLSNYPLEHISVHLY